MHRWVHACACHYEPKVECTSPTLKMLHLSVELTLVETGDLTRYRFSMVYYGMYQICFEVSL